MDQATIEAELGGEWLISCGNGGYASGRLSTARSRSYHGLLVAALRAPDDRVLVFAQVDESIVDAAGRTWLLATHQYRDGTIHPDGRRHLEAARRDGRELIWRWRLGENLVERRLEVGPGNRGRLVWTVLEGEIRSLCCRPFFSFRGHHGGAGPTLDFAVEGRSAEVGFEGRSETLRLEASAGTWRAAAVRHEDILLADERLRGLNDIEALDSPGELVLEGLEAGSRVVLDFLLEDGLPRAAPREELPQGEDLRSRLRRAMLDFFIVSPAGRPGLLAGYPWFNEWGRDTMIALPGLAVAVADEKTIPAILEAWAERERGGLLPNRLAEDAGAALYNSADAPLWFLRALFRVWRERGESALPGRALDAARSTLEAYHSGAEGGILVDPEDGLLLAGDRDSQLTWMDACFEGEAITPRYGKCVELQALYHEALLDAAELGLEPERGSVWRERAAKLCSSFRQRFMNGPGGGLEDCVDGDRSLLRPNQFVALGSLRPLLGRAERAAALEAIEPSLLTPRGPRSLGSEEPGYRGRYLGGPESRDRAYHQGTVWAWLIGPWADAVMAATADPDVGRLRVETGLAGLLVDLDQGLTGQLAEIFEGDAPHRAVGAPAQAWSVAECLRILVDHRLDVSRIETFRAALSQG